MDIASITGFAGQAVAAGVSLTSTVIGAIVTLIVGVLILAFPKALRLVLGIYLIVVGILGILAYARVV